MNLSISLTKGKGNIKHNRRKQDKHPENADINRQHLNVELLHIPLDRAYHFLFDAAVEKYNSTQKRSDRQIKNYLQKITHDKKTKVFHELVIQIGNKDEQVSISKTNEIYRDFVRRFQIENPNLYVVGAYVHNDESTPHLHLDYVPFAEFSRGLSKRVSQDKALMQMGFRDFTQWREKQIDSLSSICLEHGITREVKHNLDRHIPLAQFKAQQREIERSLEQVPQVREIDLETNFLGQIKVKSDQVQALINENTLLKAQNRAIEAQNSELVSEVESLRKRPSWGEYDRLNDNLVKKDAELLARERKLNEKERLLAHDTETLDLREATFKSELEQSFQKGYNSAKNTFSPQIERLNGQLEQKNREITGYQSQIKDLKTQIKHWKSIAIDVFYQTFYRLSPSFQAIQERFRKYLPWFKDETKQALLDGANAINEQTFDELSDHLVVCLDRETDFIRILDLETSTEHESENGSDLLSLLKKSSKGSGVRVVSEHDYDRAVRQLEREYEIER